MTVTGYHIQGSTWRCARTGRELRPGEKVYSVLYDRGAVFEREDIGVEAWQGPPEGAFSFWLGRVPPKEQARCPQVDENLLFDCFSRLAGETDPRKIAFRYVLALWLMRKKRLKFESTARRGEQDVLVLRCGRTRQTHEVADPRLTEQQVAEVQDEVQRLLGMA
jgi:hypothetical protein